jgi:hypothetical protein
MSDQRTGEPIAEPDEDQPVRNIDRPPAAVPEPPTADDVERERRPAIERIGLAAVAVVMAILFGTVGAAAFASGEYFLAAMGFVGCMMTLAVGGSTLLRG